jgi:hypothetical protein
VVVDPHRFMEATGFRPAHSEIDTIADYRASDRHALSV